MLCVHFRSVGDKSHLCEHLKYPHSHLLRCHVYEVDSPLYFQRKRFLSSYLKITASHELWTPISSGILFPQCVSSSPFSMFLALFSPCILVSLSQKDPLFDSVKPAKFLLLIFPFADVSLHFLTCQSQFSHKLTFAPQLH